MKKNIATKKKTQKESTNNNTEEVIYKELFIAKTPKKKYDRDTFICKLWCHSTHGKLGRKNDEP